MSSSTQCDHASCSSVSWPTESSAVDARRASPRGRRACATPRPSCPSRGQAVLHPFARVLVARPSTASCSLQLVPERLRRASLLRCAADVDQSGEHQGRRRTDGPAASPRGERSRRVPVEREQRLPRAPTGGTGPAPSLRLARLGWRAGLDADTGAGAATARDRRARRVSAAGWTRARRGCARWAPRPVWRCARTIFVAVVSPAPLPDRPRLEGAASCEAAAGHDPGKSTPSSTRSRSSARSAWPSSPVRVGRRGETPATHDGEVLQRARRRRVHWLPAAGERGALLTMTAPVAHARAKAMTAPVVSAAATMAFPPQAPSGGSSRASRRRTLWCRCARLLAHDGGAHVRGSANDGGRPEGRRFGKRSSRPSCPPRRRPRRRVEPRFNCRLRRCCCARMRS